MTATEGSAAWADRPRLTFAWADRGIVAAAFFAVRRFSWLPGRR